MSWTLRWCVTLSGRLLVITAIVTSERTGFRFHLVLCMLLAVNWAVGFELRKNFPFSCFLVISLLSDALSFGAMAGGAVSWVVWDDNCKNLVDRCTRKTFCKVYYLFYAALTLRVGSGILGLLMEDQAPLPVLRPYCMVALCSFASHTDVWRAEWQSQWIWSHDLITNCSVRREEYNHSPSCPVCACFYSGMAPRGLSWP